MIAQRVAVTLVGQRFVVEEEVARGGMGIVFRARDQLTGRRVALKLLDYYAQPSSSTLERFAREARMLSELVHPGIVRYVAHGEWLDQRQFLAMEWLDGVPLSRRLEAGGLTVAQSLSVARQVAAALAVAHRAEIVHRDLKPSNLFLRHDDLEQVVLLDFGLARRTFGATALTRSGRMVGTPQYMAPEQMRGERELGPPVDVFSLGCVLFECLTGQRVFHGEQLEVLLAKVLFETPPRLSSLRPALPDPLDDLVARMLARDPSERPGDGEALLRELDALGPIDGAPPTIAAASPRQQVSPSEQQLLTVFACVPSLEHYGDAPTIAADEQPSRASIGSAVQQLGAHLAWLPDGSALGAIRRTGNAKDQAVQAARCALLLLAHYPDARLAVATGRGALEKDLPAGEVVERAIRLCRAEGAPGAPVLDPVTAGLLDGRFVVEASGDVQVLVAERSPLDEARPLLGQPSPFVGRERELSLLEMALAECREESVARAVVIIAPPGAGKSRLCSELLFRLRSRSSSPEPGVQVLLGRADLMGAGSPYAPLAQAILAASHVSALDDPAAEERVRSRLSRHVEAADASRVTTFLLEMCGIKVDDAEADVALKAARADPRIMSEQVSRAFVDWLRAETRAAPTLLVLEDLHWGDALTIRLLDLVLRELPEQPLLLLGIARPEIETLFPSLWAARSVHVMRLAGLSGQASERLIRRALGERATPEVVSRLVRHSGGNALFLEELVRATAAGHGGSAPDTVLAILEARFAHFEAAARQLLRLASVFGETFWPDALTSSPGVDSGPSLAETLADLADAEVIERNAESRFAAYREYRFRHALMREAAYDLMRDEEKRAAHEMAARFLEQAGERDAMVLAEHWRHAGKPASALRHYVSAARQSFENNDSDQALARVRRGLDCGPRGQELADLRALETMLAYWKGAWPAALATGREALSLFQPGSQQWSKVMRVLIPVASMTNDRAAMGELVAGLAKASPLADGVGAFVEAGAVLPIMFSLRGMRAEARGALDRILAIGRAVEATDTSARGFMHHGHAWVSFLLEPTPWSALLHARESTRCFEAIADWRNLVLVQSLYALAQADLHEVEAGAASGRAAVALAERLGEAHSRSHAMVHLAYLLATRGGGGAAAAEAFEIAAAALLIPNLNPVYRTRALMAQSRARLAVGRADEALSLSEQAMAVPGSPPTMQLRAHEAHIAALLACGRPADAHARALQAEAILAAFGCAGNAEVPLRWICTEAHRLAGATGPWSAATAGLDAAIALRAADFPDDASRDAWLSRARGL